MLNPKNIIVEVPNRERTNRSIYRPDFREDNKLYNKMPFNNEIDIARQDPRLRDIMQSRMASITPEQPNNLGLNDEELANAMPPQGMDYNEVCEWAEHIKQKENG